MSGERSKLKFAQELAEQAVNETNRKIAELGESAKRIYDELDSLQRLFDAIRNVPNERRQTYKGYEKTRLSWKQQAEKIDSDYKDAVVRNAGQGAVGIGAGIAVAALGPTAAMGVATTFGVASTGTAISALSGAAATNAALAWLGGGALAAGGGGMAAGSAFLALAGPIGWSIAGVALAGSLVWFWIGQNDRKRLEDIFVLISERDVRSYSLAIVEMKERISRATDERKKLTAAIERTRSFGTDYNLMTETQQYELGSYVNLMEASTQLLVCPIRGLQPKYCEEDLTAYLSLHRKNPGKKKRRLVLSLANLLYQIDMDDRDRHLLWESLKGNKSFLASMEIEKNEFDFSIMEIVSDALQCKCRAGK